MIDTLNFDLNTLDRCNNVLRYNINTYLDLYRLFVSYNQPLIIQYFKQENIEADIFSFNFLGKLQIEAQKINDLISIHSNSFNRLDDWYLLDMLENIRIKLETLDNADKWLRSNKTKNNWNKTSIQYNATLSQDETLEKLSLDNNSKDSQNDWTTIAIENNLFEMDYDLNGGNVLELHKNLLSQPSIFLNSIIDRGLSGEKLYGKDFNQTITWNNNDLNILSYIDTAKQSINILVQLKQGDIPEFEKMGIDSKLTIGGNLSVLKDFKVKKQLETTVATDDSLRNFKLTKISYYNGKLNIDYSVDTMYDLTYNTTTPQPSL